MPKSLETATLGGGCYWCVEAIYENVRGVESVVSGYAGERKRKDSFGLISRVLSRRTEVLQLEFDPKVITFADIVEIFFETHDPTTLNRQGHDMGYQYRSAIFYHDDTQKETAEKILNKVNSEGKYKDKVVTKIEPYENFSPASEYEQHFYQRNKDHPYCQLIISPKVEKFKKQFKEKLK